MIEQYSMKILGAAAIIYAFYFMLGKLFPKERRKRNYFRLALYIFWFCFLWLSANFAVKCLCYFVVWQGDDIYADLSANRIFTEGMLVYMGSLTAAAGSSKENRRYGRRQKQVLALMFLIGCLAVWAVVYIQSVMEKNAVWAFGLLLFMIIYLFLLCLTENCFCMQNEEYERAKFEAGVEK